MITKKTLYAVEICAYLSGKRHFEYVTVAEISAQFGMSVSYLEEIFKILKRSELVTAARGPGGGYLIGKNPSALSVWDVVKEFEKELSVVSSAPEPDSDQYADYEIELAKVIKETLSDCKLSDLAGPSNYKRISFQETGLFKLKPMLEPLKPRAPNSVFQLHMSF